MAPADPDALLPTSVLATLDHLMLRTRRSMPGTGAGLRRSPRPGTSAEFADFRTYVPGDDFRRVDWNAYARMDRLILRLYHGEEDIALHCFVDASSSMDFGAPSKWLFSRQLALGAAYVGLAALDRVAITSFGSRLAGRPRRVRGRAAFGRLSLEAREMKMQAGTDYSSLRQAGSLPSGISIVFSDFLSESPLEPALAHLAGSRQEIFLVQVLAEEELRPALTGDVELRDAETGRNVEVTATPAVIARYQEALELHTRRLAGLAGAYGGTLITLSTATPLESVLFSTLRQGGLLT